MKTLQRTGKLVRWHGDSLRQVVWVKVALVFTERRLWRDELNVCIPGHDGLELGFLDGWDGITWDWKHGYEGWLGYDSQSLLFSPVLSWIN